jgi:hypothetical protein
MQANMANERDSAAVVVAQEGDWLQVKHKGERLKIPMNGFPKNFKLQPGSRVILADDPSGTVARPLVRAITTRLSAKAVSKGGSLQVEGHRLQLQEGTVVDRGPEPRGRGDEYVLEIVEKSGKDRPEQVIALRKTR